MMWLRRRQAAEHGLQDFEVDGATADELFEREQEAQDDAAREAKAEMATFAGLRPAGGAGASNRASRT
jgi:hypothetical protein